jgi:MFS family permease
MSEWLDTALDQRGAAPRRTPVVVRLLVVAAFVVILNETIMFNAIPRLMESFQVSEHAAQWVSTAFMLTMAAVIPVTGWFLQRVSTRTAYATAMCVFLAGTALAAVAPIFEVLLLGRVVQAAGTAVMMPLLMTTLMTVVAESDRGRVMGNVMMAIAVAPALGPTVSGLVLQLGSWRLLFLLVLPIAAVVTWFGLRQLENIGEPVVSDIDWPSVIVAALGFGSLVYGLTRFAEGEVGLPIGIAAVGVVLVGGFVARQLRLQAAQRTHPHLITADELVLRNATLVTLRVPLDRIRHVSPRRRDPDPDGRLVLGAPGGGTNLHIDLVEPVPWRSFTGRREREVTAVSLQVDDPQLAARLLTQAMHLRAGLTHGEQRR